MCILKKKGFTLIELMVVIAIIAILLATVIPFVVKNVKVDQDEIIIINKPKKPNNVVIVPKQKSPVYDDKYGKKDIY